MNIEKIKKTLCEVRKICARQNYCADCPLSVDGNCPTWDANGKATHYPERWALNGGGAKQ